MGKKKIIKSLCTGSLLVALLFCMVGVTVGLDNPVHAAGTPFPRGQGLVFISQGSPTRLFESVQLPGTNATTFSPIGLVQTITYNAMGFNPTDMFLYAINSTTNRLIQIDSTGATTGLGAPTTVTNLPALSGSNTYNSGTIGTCTPINTLWVAPSQETSTIYSINVIAAQPTAVPLRLVAGIGGVTALPNVADLVCINDGTNNYLWGVYGGGGNSGTFPNGMYRIHTTTGVIDWFSLAGVITSDWGASFGAQWLYGNGDIGISNNQTGNIHQIQIDNASSASPTFTEVAVLTGPASTTNDGASYQGEPVDLSLTKVATTDYGPSGTGADNEIYTPGSNINYTLTVTNNDLLVTSSGFFVTDTLDPAIDSATITFSSSQCYLSDPGVLGVTGATVVCVYGTLDPGQQAIFDFYVTSPATHSISITNTATVTGNEADPVSGNNTDSVTVDSAPSGFTVSKAVSPTHHVLPGETVTYTVTVTNTGATEYDSPNFATFADDLTDVLDDAVLVYPLASGLDLNSDGVTLEWSGELGISDVVTVTYEVVVNGPVTGNRLLNNSVTATHDEGGCSGICFTQTRIGVPGYSLNKTVNATEANPGDFVTYTITITNTGTAPYTAHHHPLIINDDLSDVLDDAVFTGTMSGGAHISGTTLTWRGPLAVGASTQISYTVHVVGLGSNGGNGVMNNLVIPRNAGEGACVNCTARTLVIEPIPIGSPATGSKILPTSSASHSVDRVTSQWHLLTAMIVGVGVLVVVVRKN